MRETQIVWSGLVTGSIYALVTIGFTLIYNTANFFNMAHGATFLVGGYIGYLAFRVAGLGGPISLVLAASSGGFFGLAVQKLIFQKLNQRKSSRLVLFIASLGVLVMTQGIIAAFFGNETNVFVSGPSQTVMLPGGSITVIEVEILTISIITFVLMFFFLYHSDTGKNIRAVADDLDLAKATGIPVKSVLTGVFFFGSAIAGMAGMLTGLEQSIRPSSGMTAILWAMVASIVGGINSLSGPVLGAFLIGILENFAVVFFPSEWKNSLVFSLLIIFLLIRPKGILGVNK